MQSDVFAWYLAKRGKIMEHRTKVDHFVLFMFVAAAILVDRSFGFSYVWLVVFPLALAYGLFRAYFIWRKMRS
jgi:hypothetical protein